MKVAGVIFPGPWPCCSGEVSRLVFLLKALLCSCLYSAHWREPAWVNVHSSPCGLLVSRLGCRWFYYRLEDGFIFSGKFMEQPLLNPSSKLQLLIVSPTQITPNLFTI